MGTRRPTDPPDEPLAKVLAFPDRMCQAPGMTNTDTIHIDPGTVFQAKNHWFRAVRTTSGFRHIDLGTVTGLNTKDQAIARAIELERRGQA